LAHRIRGGCRAHAAIVGGDQISSKRAPWRVALLGEIPVVYNGEEVVLRELCGGVIIGGSRVAYGAAHPVVDVKLPVVAAADDAVADGELQIVVGALLAKRASICDGDQASISSPQRRIQRALSHACGALGSGRRPEVHHH
jgi:hypothetical protein